ncbi:MAG: SLC13 family permease, partial [Rhodospirillaceae bacterium]
MLIPDIHAIGLLLLTPFVFYLFATERLPMTTVALGLLVVLVTAFSLFPYTGEAGTFGSAEVFSAFGNEALIAICALMILGRSLLITGALEPITRLISKLWTISPLITLLFALLICAVLSTVLNNTPLMIVMIAVITSAAARTGMASSKFLLPMNYAAIIGGMGTTIGSSTNIMVVSIAHDMGMPLIGMFDFLHVTAIAAIPALIFLWLVAPLLQSARSDATTSASLQLFDAWLYVPEGSDFIGKPLQRLLDKSRTKLRVLEVKRGENTYLMRFPTLTILEGDRLLVRDTRDNLKLISDEMKLPLHDLDEADLPEYHELDASDVVSHQLAELVVTPNSELAGSSVGNLRLAERTGLIVLGLRKLS